MIRILVVDDRTFTRKAINAVLETEQNFFLIGEAENGIKALELMSQVAIDIAIVDLEMPGMNGFELTAKICASFPKTKVIIFSSNKDRYSINEAVKAGAKGYLVKESISKDEIVDTINYVQKGYFQLGPGLFEELISELISNEAKNAETFLKIATQSHQDRANLQEEMLLKSQEIRHQILNELDAEIIKIKVEFRQGLTDFQDRVSKQIKNGFEDFIYNYQKEKFVPELWHKRYLQLSQSISLVESQYNLSIHKLKNEIATLRYFVIFLLIILVPVLLDRIFGF